MSLGGDPLVLPLLLVGAGLLFVIGALLFMSDEWRGR